PDRITAPADLFKGRRNSRGLDITDPLAMSALDNEREGFWHSQWTAGIEGGEQFQIVSPATGEEVGLAHGAGPEAIELSITRARESITGWSGRPVTERADILRRAADLYEANAAELYVLCAREAGKVLADAVSEV